MKNAVQNYENACEDIVKEFLSIYLVDLEENYTLEDIDWWWVADGVGEVMYVDDYFFGIHDMVTALRLDIPKDIFFAWYEKSIEEEKSINLSTYYRMHKTCTHPTKSPAKKDVGEGETNYFICDDCKEPC